MADNKIPADFLSTARMATRNEVVPRPSLTSRLAARLRAGRLDRLVAVGAPAAAGSVLAAHEAPQSLHGILLSSRPPLHTPNINGAEDLIDTITLRLHSPRPVSARGMARLRQILADGAGPLYRFGRGDLNGRLGAALAAL